MRYSATSILDVLSAQVERGATVLLEAIGVEAEAALDRLATLLVELQS